ncbi:hypothetical protein XENOCAPTIV_006579, partial [Xenoophorus captivus]
LASAGSGGPENGLLAPPHNTYVHQGERARAMSASGKSISLHGDADTISFHQLSHGNSQSDFDKSSTIPRNSDLRFQYREFAQSKRPTSTISLLAEGELGSSSGRQLSSHTATIRRKPSSKPAYRRGTISGGIPIPISTPQVPLKAVGGNGNSDENVFKEGGGVDMLTLIRKVKLKQTVTNDRSAPLLPPPVNHN